MRNTWWVTRWLLGCKWLESMSWGEDWLDISGGILQRPEQLEAQLCGPPGFVINHILHHFWHFDDLGITKAGKYNSVTLQKARAKWKHFSLHGIKAYDRWREKAINLSIFFACLPMIKPHQMSGLSRYTLCYVGTRKKHLKPFISLALSAWVIGIKWQWKMGSDSLLHLFHAANFLSRKTWRSRDGGLLCPNPLATLSEYFQ